MGHRARGLGDPMLEIRVISLAGADVRRERVHREFAGTALDFSFFDALDGETGMALFDECDERAFVLHTGRLPTPGEIGCFASHKALWQLCVDSATPLLVMEDDFVLGPRFAEAVAAAGELVSELGLLRLQDERRGASREVARYRGFRVERYTKTPHCAMCYAISPSVAKRLVDLNPRICAPVDVVMKHVWRFDNPMYCLRPYTVTGNDLSFESTIGDREKCRKPLSVRLRRLGLKITWQWHRLIFNLRQTDGRVRRQCRDARSRPAALEEA